MTLLPATTAHFDDTLALDAQAVHCLSPLTRKMREHRHTHAAHDPGVFDGRRRTATLPTAVPEVPCDSTNDPWIVARHADFLDTDRIVIAPDAGRQGVASRLLCELSGIARDCGWRRRCPKDRHGHVAGQQAMMAGGVGGA